MQACSLQTELRSQTQPAARKSPLAQAQCRHMASCGATAHSQCHFLPGTMSIPDGEYDLDLSALTEITNASSSMGVRYQFVPPTVDRSRPVTAYENGRECVLDVPLTGQQKSVLFEGAVVQNPTDMHNAAAHAYILTYAGGKVVHLKRLDRTLKVSKTRNPAKTETKLQEWKSSKRQAASSSPKPSKPSVPKRAPVASKRTPQKTTPARAKSPETTQDVIINEADFDSLESGSENEFPVFDFDKSDATDNLKPTKIDKRSTTIPDDEFAGLEDELAQVMGLPQSEESDADDYPTLVTSTPVIIDEPKRAAEQHRLHTRTNSRPMSMREWVHNGIGGSE